MDGINLKKIIKESIVLTEEKLLQESFREAIITVSLLLGAHVGLSQDTVDSLLKRPKDSTLNIVDGLMDKPQDLKKYFSNIDIDRPKINMVNDWVKVGGRGFEYQIKPSTGKDGEQNLIGIKIPVNALLNRRK